jgi:uncharacterized lipoprotein YajG
MKITYAVILTALLSSGLIAGCSGNAPQNQQPGAQPPAATSQQAPAATTKQPPASTSQTPLR